MFNFIKDRIWYIKETMQNLDAFAFHDDDKEEAVTATPLKDRAVDKINDFIERHCIVDYDENFEDDVISTPSDTNALTSEQTASDKA